MTKKKSFSALILVPSKDSIYRDTFNGSAVVLNLKSRSYFTLNKSGRYIWNALNGKTNAQIIATRLAKAFKLHPPDRVTHDVEKFVETLYSLGLIEFK